MAGSRNFFVSRFLEESFFVLKYVIIRIGRGRRQIFDRVKHIEITTAHDEKLRQCMDNTLDAIADITFELVGKESLNMQRALFHEVLLYFIKNLCSNSLEAWNVYTKISSFNPKLKMKRNPRNPGRS